MTPPSKEAQEESREQLWDRAFRAGKGVERILEESDYFHERKDVIDILCLWKWHRSYDEIKRLNSTRQLSELADMMTRIDHYTAHHQAIVEIEKSVAVLKAMESTLEEWQSNCAKLSHRWGTLGDRIERIRDERKSLEQQKAALMKDK